MSKKYCLKKNELGNKKSHNKRKQHANWQDTVNTKKTILNTERQTRQKARDEDEDQGPVNGSKDIQICGLQVWSLQGGGVWCGWEGAAQKEGRRASTSQWELLMVEAEIVVGDEMERRLGLFVVCSCVCAICAFCALCAFCACELFVCYRVSHLPILCLWHLVSVSCLLLRPSHGVQARSHQRLQCTASLDRFNGRPRRGKWNKTVTVGKINDLYGDEWKRTDQKLLPEGV